MRARRGTGLLLGVLAGALVAFLASGRAAAGTDVHGDDERDVYVGTGGLVLPGSVDAATRREVAACTGCAWRLTTPCLLPGQGNPFDGQAACTSVVRGCPGGRLLRSWFRPAAGSWRETGLVCLPLSGPVTVAEASRAAADQVERGIPGLDVGFQPGRGVLAQLPVVFRSGQPSGMTRLDSTLLGRPLRVAARPAWTWDFGDGARLATEDPGGVYPHTAVSHVYRRGGSHVVRCTTRWTAEFTVDGLGPFPVVGELRQEASTLVEVGEGRALLAPAG